MLLKKKKKKTITKLFTMALQTWKKLSRLALLAWKTAWFVGHLETSQGSRELLISSTQCHRMPITSPPTIFGNFKIQHFHRHLLLKQHKIKILFMTFFFFTLISPLVTPCWTIYAKLTAFVSCVKPTLFWEKTFCALLQTVFGNRRITARWELCFSHSPDLFLEFISVSTLKTDMNMFLYTVH